MPKKAVLILLSIFSLAAIFITLFVLQRQTELRKKAAPATTMSMSPATVTAAVGDEFNLDLVVDTGANSIQIVQIKLSYDPTKLQALSMTNTPAFPNIVSREEIGEGVAKMSVATASTVEPFTGTTSVARIRFKTLAPTDSPIRVSYEVQANVGTYVGSTAEGAINSLIGTTPANITITGSGGGVTPTISQPTPTTASGATPTRTPTAGASTPTRTPTSGGSTPTRTPTVGAGTATPTTGTSNPTNTPTRTPTPSTGNSSPTATPTPGPLSLAISALANGATTTDTTPTFSGTAKPGTTVTVTVLPTGVTGAVTVDSAGNWTFTPGQVLGLGTYTANIVASDPLTGSSETKTIAFTISNQVAASTSTPTPTTVVVASNGTTATPTPAVPVTGSADMTVLFSVLGIILLLAGTTLPFIMR